MVEVRLGTADGYAAVEVDEFGSLIMEEQPPGVMFPTLLLLPEGAVTALRDAFNGHAPPTDDADLREALNVERERVNRILDSALRGLT